MKFLKLFLLVMLPAVCDGQTITTIAGNGINGDTGDGGPAISAEINLPHGGLFDRSGNFYFVEPNSNRIRKITPGGTITTFAGNGSAGFTGDGGPATAASLNSPREIAIDTAGNLFIADGNNYRIRKVIPSGIIQTIAGNGISASSGDGGMATAASIVLPQGLCVDRTNSIYIAEDGKIRKVSASGIITTVAGTGIVGYSGDGGLAGAAQIQAHGVYADNSHNLYIADFNRIRKVNGGTGIISTIAGTGSGTFSGDGIPATAANFSPEELAWDETGNLYIADLGNNRVRRIDTSGYISTIAGTGIASFSGDGGPATAAEMYDPSGVAFDDCGNLYIPGKQNFRIRKVTFPGTATPDISIDAYPNDTVCNGTAVGFTSSATRAGAIPSYQWYVNGAPAGTGATYLYTPADGDSVSCMLTSSSPCVSTTTAMSNTIRLSVNPFIRLFGPSVAAIGSTVTITATLTGAGSSYTVRWYNHGIEFTTTTAPSVSYTKVFAVDSITASFISTTTTCYDSAVAPLHIVTDISTKVNQPEPLQVTIFPNPANDVLYIITSSPGRYTLSNIVGAKLQQGILHIGQNTVSIKDMPAGMYIAELTDEHGERVLQKIVKQ